MYYLVYGSNAHHPMDEVELMKLLHQARIKNKENGITGLLIYSESKFIQVLEGEKEAVLNLFHQIREDARHHKVSIIIEGNLITRN
ncbi:BLUF domain-containing protein, partial [Fulvivirga lutimaris]|uniref:BLUF domain-containing protein n=1 Tax=Fulvivirga lutimaris TaxID=1819566 RepID=UPI0016287E53